MSSLCLHRNVLTAHVGRFFGLPGLLYLGLGLLIWLCLLAASARADDIPRSAVPAEVLQAAEKLYPKAAYLSAELDHENGQTRYELDLLQRGNRLEATFLPTGKFIRSEERLPSKQVPAAIRQTVLQKYPGAVITEAERIVTGSGSAERVHFRLEIQGADLPERELRIDARGQVLSDRRD